jgi:hypothetical protein
MLSHWSGDTADGATANPMKVSMQFSTLITSSAPHLDFRQIYLNSCVSTSLLVQSHECINGTVMKTDSHGASLLGETKQGSNPTAKGAQYNDQ